MKANGKFRGVLRALLCVALLAALLVPVLAMAEEEEAESNVVRYAAPVMKSLTNVSGGVKIQWEKVSGATEYRVFRKVGKKGTWEKVGASKGTSLTDKKAASGTTYYYTVQATGKDRADGVIGARTLTITYYAMPKMHSMC